MVKKTNWTLLALVCVSFLVMTGQAGATATNKIDISKTKLTFEYAPALIQENARKGKFIPIKLGTKPISLHLFNKLIDDSVRHSHARIYVAVIVDDSHENWPNNHTTAQIRKVHKRLTALVIGNTKKHIPGFAELYGAHIVGVIPVSYNPKDQIKTYAGKSPSGESVYSYSKVPVDAILLAVNNFTYPHKKDGELIDSVKELEKSLLESLEKGYYLQTVAEWIAKLDKEISELDEVIEKHDNRIAEIDNRLAELDVIDSIMDSGDLDPATISGRRNREILNTWLIDTGHADMAYSDIRKFINNQYNELTKKNNELKKLKGKQEQR